MSFMIAFRYIHAILLVLFSPTAVLPGPLAPSSLFAFLLHIFFLSHFPLPFPKNSSSFCIIVSFLSLPTHKHAYTF